jgi:hypothetical protein
VAEAVKRVSKKAYECSGLALGPIVTEKRKGAGFACAFDDILPKFSVDYQGCRCRLLG